MAKVELPTVISLFAGCGGSSLGYQMAGYRELLAVEWDQNAVETFRLNFPDVPVYQGDITALSIDECLRLAQVKPGELDVLDGSPPCQGFSTAGKRIMADARNSLFHEFTRLLRGLRPKAFVMENVAGMVKGKMRLIFVNILAELKACGYAVSARALNASYFGVPQKRVRLIFIGIRDDLRISPSHPVARTRPILLREALHDLHDRGYEPPALTPLRVQRWRETRRGHAHQLRFSTLRLDWNKVAPTILMEPDSGGHMHPDEPRLLTTGELRRIASFPDDFEFAGNWLPAVNRMGNSVPPLLMQAIAEHVHETLTGEKAERG